MRRAFASLISMLVLCNISIATTINAIPVLNHSFEEPVIDPVENPFLAIPYAPSWIEDDIDIIESQYTGIFRNSPLGEDGHLLNVDGNQLAFLGNYEGNALRQYLSDTFQVGNSYRLTVSIGISYNTPPMTDSHLILSLDYISNQNPIGIASIEVPTLLTSSESVQDFSVDLPTVQPNDSWVNQNIGISMRGTGFSEGFWVIDNVRLESIPEPVTLSLLAFGGLLIRKRK